MNLKHLNPFFPLSPPSFPAEEQKATKGDESKPTDFSDLLSLTAPHVRTAESYMLKLNGNKAFLVNYFSRISQM